MLRKRGFLGRYFQVSISLVWLSHCLYLRILEVGDMGGYVTGKYGLKNLLQIKRKVKVKMGGSGAFLCVVWCCCVCCVFLVCVGVCFWCVCVGVWCVCVVLCVVLVLSLSVA